MDTPWNTGLSGLHKFSGETRMVNEGQARLPCFTSSGQPPLTGLFVGGGRGCLRKDLKGPERTWKDLNEPERHLNGPERHLNGPEWTWTDLNGPKRTWTEIYKKILSWTVLNCPELSWTVLNCPELSWTNLNCAEPVQDYCLLTTDVEVTAAPPKPNFAWKQRR
jgi:hypothetical protein